MDPKTDPVTSGPRGPLVTTWGRDDGFWGSARRNARSPGEIIEGVPERILETPVDDLTRRVPGGPADRFAHSARPIICN